jgi:PAS domain S-box-containing protein
MSWPEKGNRSDGPPTAPGWLAGGDIGGPTPSFDWSSHPLGPPDAWPCCFRLSLDLCLAARFPTCVCWGAELMLFGNDSFGDLLGGNRSLPPGRPAREAWPAGERVLRGVLQTGRPAWPDDPCFPGAGGLRCSCSPIRDEAGLVVGVFVQAGGGDARAGPAEEALGRYRLLSRSARDIVLFVRPDGRIVEANDAAVAAYGYDRGELLGMTIFQLRDPSTSGLVPEQMLQADARGITFETRHRRKDGAAFPVEVSSRGADVAGERLLLSIVRDISERKRAEEVLGRERELLQAIIDAIPVMITLYEPDTRVLRLNPEFERVTGYTAAEAAGASLMERCYPEAAERERVRRFMDSCSGGWMDVTMRRRDGGEVETSWANIRLSGGMRVGIGLDVTERRRADAALRDSEARYRDLFENANDVIYTLDLQGRITSVNRRAEETFGYTREECVGRSAADLVPPEHHATMREALRRKLAGEESPTVYEIELIRKDGARVPLEVSSRLILREGVPVGVQGIARDVSERRRVEAALREADRRKDEFLAMLAHELRNPLAPIRNAAAVLRLRAPSEQHLAQARDVIERQAAHMARLVDDLLDVSRITRGKILLRKKRLDLVELVRCAAEDHRALLAATGLALAVELCPGPLWVEGDSTRLAQVVGNLLHNANKFTDPGGRVQVALGAGGEGEAVLVVRDTGIGMDEGMLARLFEPFSQADGGLDRTRGGLGLGLALVKGLVELHGGAVAAASGGPGRGSALTVRLPLCREGPASPPGRGQPTSGGASRVLVIEDHLDAAESLRMLLELWGYGSKWRTPARRGWRPPGGFARTWSCATSACPAAWTATPSRGRSAPTRGSPARL